MDDLISRAQAIDAVISLCDNCDSDYCGSCRVNFPGEKDARKVLEDLPSAEPEPCGDVVSRNAIVQKLNKMDRYVSTELRLCDTDKKFPQNEVFIVDDVYEEIWTENVASQYIGYAKESTYAVEAKEDSE